MNGYCRPLELKPSSKYLFRQTLGIVDLDPLAALTNNNDVKGTSLITQQHFTFSGTGAYEQTQAKVGMPHFYPLNPVVNEEN